MNQPDRNTIASRKSYQLKVAQALGFTIPETLITNVPSKVIEFKKLLGNNKRMIFKPFAGSINSWRETRIFGEDEFKLLDTVKYAPVIFQEYIEAVADLRITIVGKEIFAAAINANQTDYPIDFRMHIQQATIRKIILPQKLQDKLHKLMAFLGLEYGAIDMRKTKDNEFVFLEINPAGQWLFIEEKTKQPISSAIANILCSKIKESKNQSFNMLVS